MERIADGTAAGASARAGILDEIDAVVESRVEPSEKNLARDFCRLFFAKAPPEFFQGRGAESLAALALGAFRMLQRSRRDEVNVELCNPEAAGEGWRAPVTVLRTDVSERPFIVDTIREYLHAEDLAIERFLHPVMQVVRDDAGTILDLGPASAGEPRESLVHCEISRIEDPERMQAVGEAVRAHLLDVVRATDDFEPMQAALDDATAYLLDVARRFPERAEEVEEVQNFVRWLRDDHFVFLGYRAYDILQTPKGPAIVVEPGSGLGILRNEAASTFSEPMLLADLPSGLRERVSGGPLLITSKTNATSTVHRRARMDYIGIKKIDADGHVVGELRFIGLFTSRAYSEDAGRIPILREKLREILQEAGVIKGSHDYKEIITIFNSMPKEDLFLTSAERIGSDIQAALALYHTDEVKVTLRPDPLDRGVSVMVILPKEKFSGDVRKAIEQAFLARLGGDVLNYHLALGGGDQARLHFYFSSPPGRGKEVDPAELEGIVRRLTRSWADRVRAGLEEVHPGEEARRLANRYSVAFSAEYRAATEPDIAEQDILELEAMRAEGRHVAVVISNPASAEALAVDEPVSQVKLFVRGGRLVLSEFMPILDNAGLRVMAMTPFEVHGPGVEDAAIYVFAVQDSAGEPIDLVEHAGALSELILDARAGEAANDPLNALILSAGLAWREIDVLRAYSEYAFQLQAVPSRLSLVSALRAYPSAAELLIRLFATRFDPALELSRSDRLREALKIERSFIRSLESVTSLADDRALRRLLTLVSATVRTNYYRHGGARPTARSGGVPYISLKFSCFQLGALARGRLKFEVWVQSSRMAGVHLRGASVARGGIRYSDRPDDFRTEIMGLVKTQMVKNAVIVPGGSKGGFVTRRQLGGREAMLEEAAEQYRTLMRGLLDITDNLVDGEIVHPPDVIFYDEPDPYLVVAADKGTAHLSDVANAISAEYGFWLGDAFASGGSHGYDHKVVGITAKGAWECVRRHFSEMGRDIQSEPFTVVGIGDMSGDVFGNGMLLSRTIRLIAAFDHRHIFVDPTPDPAVSYAERARLFDAGRSSWDDYDRSTLSEGGFIVPRGVKEVAIPPEARVALGLEETVTSMDGESLMRAILAAPVDLLWNGGIGTYVKSSVETDTDVGDSANDAVRIDADALRAKVIGEGGNLGLTQRARVEYALRGGRLNTDALDNSGGVDMSDREVNLKILLNAAVSAGRLDMDRRNTVLEDLTPAVTDLVLHDNRSQSLAVSLEEVRARDALDEFQGVMSGLEREGLLDRAGENLPSLEELAERHTHGRSLTRPELAVLLAYGKLALKASLLASPLPDDDATASYLIRYFPDEAIEAAGRDALAGHRLRREITASQLTNELVDLMGATFAYRLARDTGHSPAAVARAWLIASRLCGAPSLRESLSDVERELDSGLVYRWLLGLARVLERTTRWVLANVEEEVPTGEVIEQHLEGLGQLRDRFGEIVAGEERQIFEERVREIQDLIDKFDLAQRLITLRFLDQLLEILRVARETGMDPVRVGQAYYLASELVGIPWLRRRIFEVARDDRWEQRAANLLADDLGRAHRRLTERIVDSNDGEGSVERLLEGFRSRYGTELASYRALLDEVRSDDGSSLAALSVVGRELSEMFG